MHERLDIEPQGGTNSHDIFAIEPLQNGRLSSIIEPTAQTRDVSGWMMWVI